MAQVTLLLHNIRSTHNVGSIFRSADGFGVKKIYLSGYTPYPMHPADERLPHIATKIQKQIDKTALGATSTVPFEYCADPYEALDSISIPIIGLEQSPSSHLLKDFTAPPELLLILGEEVEGISESLLSRCDDLIEIPMQGTKESFNVSVAAGIALYALTT
jgi:23S rRNA (guanosine2251-2'-O)-methyltransferase